MPTVKIGTTDKRINSTKQTFNGTSLNCKLKEPCSMQSPVFEVQGLTKGMLFNYAQFENRYYWIDDVIYLTNEIQEVHCHLDPLATFKTAIGNTSAFVKYSAKTANWAKVVDDLRMQPEMQQPVITADQTIVNAFHNDIVFSRDNGSVVIRVMQTCGSPSDPLPPGIHTYAMSMSVFREVLTDLQTVFTNIVPTDPIQTLEDAIDEFTEFLSKLFAALGGGGSWSENLLSAVYLPIDISSFSAHSIGYYSGIYVGSIPCNAAVAVYELPSSGVYLNHADTVAIPWNSETTTYPYLKNPRWNCLQAILPGTYMEIDTTDIKDQPNVGWYSCINLCSGEWTGKLNEMRGDAAQVLASASGCIAIDILGMVGTGMTEGRTIGNIIGKIVSMAPTASGADLTPAQTVMTKSGTPKQVKGEVSKFTATNAEVMNVSSGIMGTFLSTGVSVGAASGNIGGGGTELFLLEPGTTTLLGKLILHYVQYIPRCHSQYDAYCLEYGYPCQQYLKLSDCAGYTCCVGASVGNGAGGIGGSEANKSTINSYLNSGFYYE
ncbi:MAG: hypothetical protein VZR53_08890 [Prevotella sp.]|nr:hypothetical protein [Prevotella sp.]